MEKVIHIASSHGAVYDVLVTEEELTSFRELAASAAQTGQKISFDEWALEELRKVFADVSSEGDDPMASDRLT